VSFANNPDIRDIYGAEPAVGLHKTLKQQVELANLTSKYHILAAPAEKTELLAALAREGVKPNPKGIFDTIICIRVLCGVPNFEETIKDFHDLLRPGGELMVVEHIKNPWRTKGSLLGRLAQIVYHLLGWTFFLGGCEMNRDTPTVLRRAAAWEAVELKTYFEWSALPYVAGTLTKKY
jgi:SAM-dependent methyltransferase